MNVDGIYSEIARTPEESWALLRDDPLAYIRELALAHEEKRREAEANVIDLDDYRERRIPNE